MRFFSDVQIHSKWSRATSRNADIDHLALWARKKGIAVVGTGDFTHPAWLAEIREKLEPAEAGLFKLRADVQKWVDENSPAACRDAPVRFMLEVEISTIYKKWDKVRKVHHLIFCPDLGAADRLVTDLAKIGNLKSDGRPILGLDSRDLLEITLESGPDSYLIPAHIWTPWFAALGSKSGFDRIEDCYGDLADHVFAVETGLSSDPAMNWRISSLDKYRLVSNSDAHSPPKIGRESTFYDTDLDYFAILKALKTGEGFGGTVEFFPEEGKYHQDGHRGCDIRFTPEQTKAHDGICPVCGKQLTVGVSHRIDSLADRTIEEALANPPPKAAEVLSLVPLPEILSEIEGVGVNSKRVQASYEHCLSTLGHELHILQQAPLEDIRRKNPLLAEAIARLRRGQVIREAGYDGEYGVIRMFEEQELKSLTGGGLLFELPEAKAEKPQPKKAVIQQAEDVTERKRSAVRADSEDSLAALDPDQRRAAEIVDGPLLIMAGPGSGKTRTLTHRMAHMIRERGTPADRCLAVTFTRRAAFEMRERLADLLPDDGEKVHVHTFHSLALAILKEQGREVHIADEAERTELLMETLAIPERKARKMLGAFSRAKRTGTETDGLPAYRKAMAVKGWVDFDDLIAMAIDSLDADPQIAARYDCVSIDEYQDVDAQQYRLVKRLAPAVDSNLCVIGDPDQAIYGFRGGDARFFDAFHDDYPQAPAICLARNYRSASKIVTASAQVISAASPRDRVFEIIREAPEKITVHDAATDRAEAEFVIKTIEQLIGGHNFFSLDTGRSEGQGAGEYGFSDFAVLYRTEAQADALIEAFERSGMPFLKYSNNRLIDQPEIRDFAVRIKQDTDPEKIFQELGQHGEFINALYAKCENDAQRLLQELQFATQADTWDPRADRIALMTIHAAKGLEFPNVFLPGLEDGILPLHWGKQSDTDLEEERRLLYVGMTRAQDRLFLSHARKRLWRGASRTFTPSPFLRDIEHALLARSQTDVRARRKEEAEQLALFG